MLKSVKASTKGKINAGIRKAFILCAVNSKKIDIINKDIFLYEKLLSNILVRKNLNSIQYNKGSNAMKAPRSVNRHKVCLKKYKSEVNKRHAMNAGKKLLKYS